MGSFWFLLARSSSHVNGCACAMDYLFTFDPQNYLYQQNWRFQKCSISVGTNGVRINEGPLYNDDIIILSIDRVTIQYCVCMYYALIVLYSTVYVCTMH